jgi:hypothetical protein
VLAPSTSLGQFLFLDTNGDAQSSSEDTLNPMVKPTQVSVYLDTIVRRFLRDALRPQGWADVRWDGKTDLGHQTASGVYFARMRVGSESFGQRVVLLK